MTRCMFCAILILACSVATERPALAACLPLLEPELRELDAQTEDEPVLAIRGAVARLAKAGANPSVLRAQLFAVVLDAQLEMSHPDPARAAIASARTALQHILPTSEVRRLRLRIDLTEDQLAIMASNYEAAVTATSKLLDGWPEDSLERACTLSMRAMAYDYLHKSDRAVADALAAYRIAQDGNWSNARLETAYTLARIFSRAGLLPQAENMIGVVIEIATAEKKKALLSTVEYEQGILLVKARRFAEARAALESSKVYASQVGDRFAVAATNATLCWALLNEGDLDAADLICNSAEGDLASGHRVDLQTLLVGYRARLDLERHHPLAALIKLDSILTPSLHAILPGPEPLFHWDRARALVLLHRYRESAADFMRMRELEEAADSARTNRQVAVLSGILTADVLNAANRQLQSRVQRQQQELTLQGERRKRWDLLSLAAVLISALLAYFLWVSRRHTRFLRHDEIILRSAGVNAPDSFVLLDARRCVRFANRNLCTNGPVPAVGAPVGEGLPAPLQPVLLAAIKDSFECRSVVSFSASIEDSENSPRHFEFCVVPAIDNGQVIGGALRAIDVTDRRALEKEVVDGASLERQRLSSELHEGLGQQLAGVVLLLGNVANVVRRGLPNVGSLIEEIAGHVQQSIVDTRELACGLAPVKIGSGSLSVALQNLARDALRRLHIMVECDCELGSIALSDLAADHLYRICREAVNNAALHGQCATVQLAVRVRENVLDITISDDGLGMPDGGPTIYGLGLKMMAYRARLLGGNLTLSARGAGGMIVLVTVPLAQVVGDVAGG